MPILFQPRQDYPAILRKLVATRAGLPVPGVFSPLVGIQARQAGFECLYLSGAALSAGLGMPDLGLFTLSELSWQVERTVDVARLPLIVDADTGFGETLNVARTVRQLESAGAAAVQIEDQELPKKCGHLEGKQLVSPEEMAEKVAAAVAVRTGMLVIARTDARAIEGVEGAVRRAQLYRQAGADIIFPEALESEEEFALVAREVPGPLLANMTEFGRSPLIPAQRLGELGYQLVLFPVGTLRIAMRATEGFLKSLAGSGTQRGMVGEMLTRQELYDLIGYQDYVDFDEGLRRRGGPEGE